MVREKQEKMDKEQKKQLAEGLLTWGGTIPMICPLCGTSTKNEIRATFIRREYPDPEGYDVMFRCKICDESFQELK